MPYSIFFPRGAHLFKISYKENDWYIYTIFALRASLFILVLSPFFKKGLNTKIKTHGAMLRPWSSRLSPTQHRIAPHASQPASLDFIRAPRHLDYRTADYKKSKIWYRQIFCRLPTSSFAVYWKVAEELVGFLLGHSPAESSPRDGTLQYTR